MPPPRKTGPGARARATLSIPKPEPASPEPAPPAPKETSSAAEAKQPRKAPARQVASSKASTNKPLASTTAVACGMPRTRANSTPACEVRHALRGREHREDELVAVEPVDFLLTPGYARAVAALGAPALPPCPLHAMFPNYTDNKAAKRWVSEAVDDAAIDRVLSQGDAMPPPVYWRVQGAILAADAPLRYKVARGSDTPPEPAVPGSSPPPRAPGALSPSALQEQPPNARPRSTTPEKRVVPARLGAPMAAVDAALLSTASTPSATPNVADYRTRLYREARRHARDEAVSAAEARGSTRSPVDLTARAPKVAVSDRSVGPSTQISPLAGSTTSSVATNGMNSARTSSGGAAAAAGSSSSVSASAGNKYKDRAGTEMLQHLMSQVAVERDRADAATDKLRSAEAAATLERGKRQELEAEVALLKSELRRARDAEGRAIDVARREEEAKRDAMEELAVTTRDLEALKERILHMHNASSSDAVRRAVAERDAARHDADAVKVRLGEVGVELARVRREFATAKEEAKREAARVSEELRTVRDALKRERARAEDAARALKSHQTETLELFAQLNGQVLATRTMALGVIAEDEGARRARISEREAVVRAQVFALEVAERKAL